MSSRNCQNQLCDAYLAPNSVNVSPELKNLIALSWGTMIWPCSVCKLIHKLDLIGLGRVSSRIKHSNGDLLTEKDNVFESKKKGTYPMSGQLKLTEFVEVAVITSVEFYSDSAVLLLLGTLQRRSVNLSGAKEWSLTSSSGSGQ